MFLAKVAADSIFPNGQRLVSILARFPRSILSEMNTHTILSKNTSSSRAIPYSRKDTRKEWQPMTMREMVMEVPYIPIHFGSNKPGMQPGDEIPQQLRTECIKDILRGRDQMVAIADSLWIKGMHKGDVNRYIEPWAWTTQLLTGTQWTNFFALRTPEPPHPAMKRIARMMYLAYHDSVPIRLDENSWHMPFIDNKDKATHSTDLLLELSVARCARLSYVNFNDGKRDKDADLALFNDLRTEGHWSPFGHQAKMARPGDPKSNLANCLQYRKLFHNECVNTFTVSDDTLTVWRREVESPTYGDEFYSKCKGLIA